MCSLIPGRDARTKRGKGKGRWIILLVLAFVLLWDPAWRLAGVEQVFPWKLKHMLQENQDAFYLADVRTPMEYEWFHIPGAVNLPELLLDGRLPEGAEGKTVVVICMTGHRSPVTVYRLERSDEVYNLTWGMVGWVLSGGATVPGESRRE